MRRWLWLLILLAWVGVSQAQGPRVVIVKATTGAVIADLVVTTTSQQVVAFSGTRMGIICWNQGASPNAIRIGFGATPTATSGYFLLYGSGFTDDGTYTINAIRDTGATGNPTLSCSTVSQ